MRLKKNSRRIYSHLTQLAGSNASDFSWNKTGGLWNRACGKPRTFLHRSFESWGFLAGIWRAFVDIKRYCFGFVFVFEGELLLKRVVRVLQGRVCWIFSGVVGGRVIQVFVPPSKVFLHACSLGGFGIRSLYKVISVSLRRVSSVPKRGRPAPKGINITCHLPSINLCYVVFGSLIDGRRRRSMMGVELKSTRAGVIGRAIGIGIAVIYWFGLFVVLYLNVW